jgi:hypothetical protein
VAGPENHAFHSLLLISPNSLNPLQTIDGLVIHLFPFGIFKNASTSPTGRVLKTSCFLNQPFRASLIRSPR